MAKETKAASAQESGGGSINTGVAVIGFVLCFLAGAGIMWGYDQSRIRSGDMIAAEPAGGSWSDEDSPIPVSSKDPTWGSRTAPVTIVLFSDFQCPFCSRVESTLEQVRTTYGPEKVRIVWKNEPLPFHPNAKPAAEAAQGVFALKGADAFWKFHALAFKNQNALTKENFEKWAKEAGVTDMAKFKAGLESHTWAKKVDDDHELAKKVGVNGTPASYVNGVALSGAQPFDKFKSVIDAELQKAQAKIAAGTAKDKVYVAMTQENRKNAPPPAEEEEEREDTKSVFKVPVGDSPVLGNKNALVTIAVFSDFQCPYCKRVEPTLKQVRDTYGDKVRIVWKHEPLPFHPRANPAAQLAEEARAQKGEDAFWKAHDKLFEIQPKLDDADLEAAAKDLGLNVDKVKDAIKSKKYEKRIAADMDLADDLQASGTPHFFINGRRLVGAQPFEKFQKMIDEEVKKARRGHRERGGEALRRQGEDRLAQPPAPHAPGRAPGRPGLPRGLQAEGLQGLLGDARQALCQSAGSQARDPGQVRQGAEPRHGQVEDGPRHRRPQGRRRRRRQGRQRRRHHRHAGLRHQRLLPERRPAAAEVQEAHRPRPRRGQVS